MEVVRIKYYLFNIVSKAQIANFINICLPPKILSVQIRYLNYNFALRIKITILHPELKLQFCPRIKIKSKQFFG